jgi:Tol biopolymer transport system component
MFRNPKFSEDGSKLLFSSTVSSGLWLHDLQRDSTYQLNDKLISAGDYTTNLSGTTVIFIHSSYDNEVKKRNFYIGMQALDTDSVSNIYESDKRLNQLALTKDDNISFFDRDSLIILDYKTGRNYDWGDKNINVLKASRGSIIEYSYRNMNRYPVVERGNVLWPQYVDESTFLFNRAGQGTFLFDRITGTAEHVGNYNHPVYCPRSKLIAYVNEKSDGHTVTTSRIYVVSLDGKKAVPVDPANSYVEENQLCRGESFVVTRRPAAYL